MRTKLPKPDQQDRDRSVKLEQQISREIDENDGMISFDRYMYMCLYAEQLGYYTSKQPIFGQQGDFVTSSETSAYFAKAFAQHLIKLQSQLDQLNIIEVGAGSGLFAAQLLTELVSSNAAIKQYYIVEKSAALRARQQAYLSSVVPQQISLVQWVTAQNDVATSAVVIANEVIDALPVRLLAIQRKELLERCVQRHGQQGFSFIDIPADNYLTTSVLQNLENLPVLNSEQRYHTEICLQLPGFIQQIASLVRCGIFFFIDYGYPRSEYYTLQRTMGTLLCHFRNIAHDNPLIWPGLQDISSNVDFTALANAGSRAGLELNSYSTQAHFLLASNILESIARENSALEIYRSSQQLQHLMLPSEMGERFQVMTFTKGMTLDHDQFTTRDLTYRL